MDIIKFDKSIFACMGENTSIQSRSCIDFIFFISIDKLQFNCDRRKFDKKLGFSLFLESTSTDKLFSRQVRSK